MSAIPKDISEKVDRFCTSRPVLRLYSSAIELLLLAERTRGADMFAQQELKHVRELAEERERCAKIAESMDNDGRSNWGAFVATRIRSAL